MTMPTQCGCLALDIGGTKLMTSLVIDGQVAERAVIATSEGADAKSWLGAAYSKSREWSGRYNHVAAAVTGILSNGNWSSFNKKTLAVSDDFPLVSALESLFQCPAFAINDAQAATWGEYQYGSAKGKDTVFLTISTGVGGGIILDGILQTGKNNLAGHFGQWRDGSGRPFESLVSGRWFASQGSLFLNRPVDARDVFSACENGESWAEELVESSSRRVAELCWNIQITVDPEIIVLGGGIGLAPGYLSRVKSHLEKISTAIVPSILGAQLGDEAGVLGVADLSLRNQRPN